MIFRNVANSVLPYTEGTGFDNEENSYQENGIAPVGQETETESPEEDKGFFDTVKERAAGIVDDAKKPSMKQIFLEKHKMPGILSKVGLDSKK